MTSRKFANLAAKLADHAHNYRLPDLRFRRARPPFIPASSFSACFPSSRCGRRTLKDDSHLSCQNTFLKVIGLGRPDMAPPHGAC